MQHYATRYDTMHTIQYHTIRCNTTQHTPTRTIVQLNLQPLTSSAMAHGLVQIRTESKSRNLNLNLNGFPSSSANHDEETTSSIFDSDVQCASSWVHSYVISITGGIGRCKRRRCNRRSGDRWFRFIRRGLLQSWRKWFVTLYLLKKIAEYCMFNQRLTWKAAGLSLTFLRAIQL